MDERVTLLLGELHEGGADLGALTAAFSALERGRRPREAFDAYFTAAHSRRRDALTAISSEYDDLYTALKEGTHAWQPSSL